MAGKLSPNRENILKYAEATILNGESKSVAYKRHVDSAARNPAAAASSLEKRKEFKAIADVLETDSERELQYSATKVKKKYLNLMEKNIEAMSDTIKTAQAMDKTEGTAKNTAMAIRLANETLTAVGGIVQGPVAPDKAQKKLDYSGFVE